MSPKRILIIQTAFIGDVILTTSMVETLISSLPDASIDFLVRKGNEQLLENNPNIHKVLIWDKKNDKFRNLFGIISSCRSDNYDVLINLQRYLSTGLISFFAKAKMKIGFSQNPMSFGYDVKIKHEMGSGEHDIYRNHQLIKTLASEEVKNPRLYPDDSDYENVAKYKDRKYITLAPASVWFTKQFPEEKWIEFLDQFEFNGNIFFIGGPDDYELSEEIIANSSNKNCINLCGKMTFLESAALVKDAEMNYVNDSAPQHICSAMNAPVTTMYCSTIPEFGFGPLSDDSRIVQTKKSLSCRPCGLHGHRQCPEGHFDCALSIDVEKLNLTDT